MRAGMSKAAAARVFALDAASGCEAGVDWIAQLGDNNQANDVPLLRYRSDTALL